MYYNKLIFELSQKSRIGHDLVTNSKQLNKLPNNLRRQNL